MLKLFLNGLLMSAPRATVINYPSFFEKLDKDNLENFEKINVCFGKINVQNRKSRHIWSTLNHWFLLEKEITGESL